LTRFREKDGIMENKRLILAIVLSFLVLVLFQVIFVKNKPETAVQPEGPAQAEIKSREPAEKTPLPPAVQAQKQREEVQEAQKPEEASAQSEELIVIDTPLYEAVWSNRGASLRSWKLKMHKNEQQEELELVSSRAAEVGRYPFSLETQDADLDKVLNTRLYVAPTRRLSLRDGEAGEAKFEYSDGKSIKIDKTFVFYGGRYDFDIRIDLWKDGKKIDPRVIWGPGIGDPLVSGKRQQFGGGAGIAVLVADKVHRIDQRKYKSEASAFNFISWAAYEDNYMAALFLTPPQQGSAIFERETQGENFFYFLSVSLPERSYIGPKEFNRLKEFGHSAKKLINFGFFGAITEVLLISLKFIHRYIPNWGFCIIVLTFLIKVLFFPLTYSSTRSMARMQELQPKIKALRAKYKKAKQDIAQRRQMNEEMMRLYKEHGINPAGGCLPMLIQIPVFWGFFRLLVVAVELRQSPFIFWIKDLTVHDPYYVTPILMGVTQYISQKMTPTTADPAQAKMMLIMPAVMTIFFMNFQAGLVLYWLTNNVLQIGQQYIMNRMMAKKKRESHGKRRNK
jgi:YidC/Oxa1 family membrane protein insertase